jgi:hypothetical protein
MKKEQFTVDTIERECRIHGRYFINVHGSMFSRNGTPDFITHDKEGQFVAIEAKQLKKAPVVNQWARGIEVLRSGGRFIVAYEDFELEKIDEKTLPIFYIDSKDGYEEFDLVDVAAFNTTTEVKLRV